MEPVEDGWDELATTTHQDHVIAHVVGTTALGYFVLRDEIHLLLDIGFIWKIYVDAEMGLLPHPVAVAELDANDELLAQVKTDIEVLLRNHSGGTPSIGFSRLTVRSVITNVQVLSRGDSRKLVIACEVGSVEIQTSVTGETIRVTESEA